MTFSRMITLALVVASACLVAGLRINSCRKGVWALTFDDGPIIGLTTKVLDILKEEEVKATFFVLGTQLDNKPVHKAILQRAFDEGHQIASHTYGHVNLTGATAEEITKQMKDTDEQIQGVIGKLPFYMRVPYGECDKLCLSTLESLNYVVTFWNVDSRDFEPISDEQFFTNMMHYDDGKGPGVTSADEEGIISLQNDIQRITVKNLAEVLKMIKEKKYTFETVAECGHRSDNRPPAYRIDTASLDATVPSSVAPVEQPQQQTQKPADDTNQNNDVKKTKTDNDNSGLKITVADGSGFVGMALLFFALFRNAF